MGAKTLRFTVRGRSRARTIRFRALHSDLAQQNPRSQVSNCADGRRNPISTCPVPSICSVFGRKKRQHATAEPEYATRKPRRAAKPQRPRRSPATPQVRNAHPKPRLTTSGPKKSEAQAAPRIRMLDYRQKDRQFGDGRYIAQNLPRQFAALNDFSKPSSGSPSASPENMVRFKSIARTTSMVNAATMIV